MTSPSKTEVIKQAIKQVMEEVRDGTKSTSSDGVDDNKHHHRLLSKLMSQLEKLEVESEELPFPDSKSEFKNDGETTKTKSKISRSEEDDKVEEIVKELKEVKRQNLITHCLLSVMIVLTVVWQVSEVSIILKLKDGVSNPLRAIGWLFKTMIKPPKPNGNGNGNGNHDDTHSLITSNLIESTSVHDLKIPDFPHLDLPKIDFDFNYED